MPKINSIAFPFQVGAASFPKPAIDSDAIRASLIQIVTTGKQERVMRPTFGCRAFDFIFENDSEATRVAIEREVRSAIGNWEPRVAVNAVQVETNEITEPGQVLVTIFYTIKQTGATASVTIAGGI